jgi:uncharacterized membrane protein HdeD (DUF308 family)
VVFPLRAIDWKEDEMSEILRHYWWVLLLRGIAAILFGLVTIAWPGLSLFALTGMFGGLALVDGLTNIVGAAEWRRRDDRWLAHLLMGLAGLVVGVVTLLAPGMTALMLLVFIALWSIATGMLGIAMAIRLREDVHGEIWVALAGVLSVVTGLLLLIRPGAGAIALEWLIGSYALAVGAILVVVAFAAHAYTRRALVA